MERLKYLLIIFSLLLYSSTALYAQEKAKPDSTNIYIGEAIGKSHIQAEELPKEVVDSLKTSEYGNMKMTAIFKIDVVPGKETATEKEIRATDSTDSQRPYRMHDDDLDINETYYQDTYNDMQSESAAEAQSSEQKLPENVDTYYEIEVNGGNDAYVLLFSEHGKLTHSIPQDI